MPIFEYKGRNRRGEAVKGRIEGLSTDAVAVQLFNSGVTPIDISAARAGGGDVLTGLSQLLGDKKVQLVDLVLFCRQMYSLLRAGVPILQALRNLRDSTQNPKLARTLGSMLESLDAGLDLTSAAKRHSPEVFSPLMISLIQVGETTGGLAEAFQQLAIYLDRERNTRGRIKQAMRYPMFVLIAIAIALVIIIMVVIPPFAKLYAGFKVELPWATRLLIGLSDFMVSYWYLVFGAIALAIMAFRAYVRTPEGSYKWDKAKLKMPVVGKILFQAMLARFTRTLAVTMKAGVPLVQGMTVVSRAVDNDYISERIVQMRDGVERGETITRTAAMTGMFPPLVIQMIAVGEEAGSVDDLMLEVADYYDREVDYDISKMSDAIQPILITVVGVMVLILALGVFLPWWNLISVFKGGRG
jgi:MSHA biogenesis protein MshG